MKRMVSLAQALSADGVRAGALNEAEGLMHTVLDSLAVRFETELKAAMEEVLAVRGMTISGKRRTGKLTYDEFVEQADDRAILVGFDDAKKAFGADIASSYVNHLAADADDDEDDGLRDAFVKVAALAVVPEVRERVDKEALEFTERWFDDHRVAVKELTDERRQAFATIEAATTEPQLVGLQRPRTRMEDFAVETENGQIAIAPMVNGHLMSDDEGMFPTGSLNAWEDEVVAAEIVRSSFRAWYRNPRQASDSLGVAYRDNSGDWRTMHPDFVFFNEVGGKIVPSIVDPHGYHLEDSLIKLQALTEFAAKNGSSFHRVEALAKVGNTMRVLDLQIERVRAGIRTSELSPLDLYGSDLGADYDPART